MAMMTPGSMAVVPAATVRLRNRDTEYRSVRTATFYYLTGFDEPDAVLVLAPGREHGEVILFCRDHDRGRSCYDGERVGPDRAVSGSASTMRFPVTDVDDILPGMLEGRERIYMTLGEYPELDNKVLHWVNAIRAREAGGAVPPGEFVALKHLLHEQRLFKSAAEIRIMREAARITCAAHRRAMAACRPGMTELALEAELVHEFMVSGARAPAYPCIVGSGANACVLHYTDNRACCATATWCSSTPGASSPTTPPTSPERFRSTAVQRHSAGPLRGGAGSQPGRHRRLPPRRQLFSIPTTWRCG
jgi:Xaa-Pro aminopeptidase